MLIVLKTLTGHNDLYHNGKTCFKTQVLKRPHEYGRPCEIRRRTRTNEIYIKASVNGTWFEHTF